MKKVAGFRIVNIDISNVLEFMSNTKNFYSETFILLRTGESIESCRVVDRKTMEVLIIRDKNYKPFNSSNVRIILMSETDELEIIDNISDINFNIHGCFKAKDSNYLILEEVVSKVIEEDSFDPGIKDKEIHDDVNELNNINIFKYNGYTNNVNYTHIFNDYYGNTFTNPLPNKDNVNNNLFDEINDFHNTKENRNSEIIIKPSIMSLYYTYLRKTKEFKITKNTKIPEKEILLGLYVLIKPEYLDKYDIVIQNLLNKFTYKPISLYVVRENGNTVLKINDFTISIFDNPDYFTIKELEDYFTIDCLYKNIVKYIIYND